MLSIPSPAGKVDSDLGLCALSILTDKGDEMDSNINTRRTSVRGAAESMTNWGLEPGWWS